MARAHKPQRRELLLERLVLLVHRVSHLITLDLTLDVRLSYGYNAVGTNAVSSALPGLSLLTLRPRAGRPPRTAPPGAVHQTHHLGPHPIIGHFLERLMLEGIIRSCVGGARQGVLDHARTLAVLVHNLLVSPGPLYRIATWLAPVEPAVLGLTPVQAAAINDDRVARALDALTSERGRSIWFRLALRIIKQFELDTRRFHHDTTTVTFHGAYATSSRLAPGRAGTITAP